MILAILSDNPTLRESIEFISVGFLVIILVLSSIWLVTSLAGRIFQWRRHVTSDRMSRTDLEDEARRRKVASIAAIASMSTPQPEPGWSGGGLPPHFVAIITAAAHEVLDEPIRIVSIRSKTSNWGTEGRRQIFASKHLR